MTRGIVAQGRTFVLRALRAIQLYDNFTISVVVWLEHAGFCKRGEGGAFVEGGRIRLGGELPVNTAGGARISDAAQ